MAFIIDNLPPPSKKSVLSIDDFSGALNNTTTPNAIEDNQISSSFNMVYSDMNTLEKRNGQVYHDAVDLTNPVTYQSEYTNREGVVSLLRATDTELYKDAVKLIDVAGRVHSQEYIGNVMFTDGDKLYWHGKIDDLSASVHYTMTGWVDAYVTLEVITPPAYTPLDSTYDIGVWDYNFTAGTVHYEPCQNELDYNLKGANFVPENPSVIVNHGDRMFLSGDKDYQNNVFLSDISNPFYFPVALGVGMEPNGDKVVGMKVFMDSVVIGREHDVYVLYGNTAITGLGDDFLLKKINTHTGFANSDAVDVVHNYLFYLGSDGDVYRMITTQTNVDVITTQVSNLYCDFKKEPFNLSIDEIRTAKSVFHDDVWYLMFNDKAAVYSYKYIGWLPWNNMNCSSIGVYNDTLLFGRYDGRTTKLGEEFLDLGVPYRAYFSTKRHDFGDTTLFKHFREIYMVSQVYTGFDSDIDVLFELDHVDIKFQVNVKSAIPRFGTAVWGDKFIDRDIPNSDQLAIGQRGRLIKITVSNSQDVGQTVADIPARDALIITEDGYLIYVSGTSEYYVWSSSSDSWVLKDVQDYNQPMKVYEFSITYEPRGRR